MNIAIPVKLVPDLVEELAIDASETSLDYDWLRLKLNELDDHAIEQGLLLKERYGGQVSIIALEDEYIDEVLFTASARGVDQLIKIGNGITRNLSNHFLMQLFVPVLQGLQPDLILCGVQAHNDIDGAVGPLVAEALGFPYIGYVSGITVEDGRAIVHKEFPGGLIAEMVVKLPAVLGVQASENPPRYIAYSKIRQAMQTAKIEDSPAVATQPAPGPVIERLYQPTSGVTAEMIEGSLENVADRVVSLFKEIGII
jgi:electron transfer flavoprotein beta subunit